MCDAHIDNETKFYLEVSRTGDCYSLCSPIELQWLVSAGFPPCGHDVDGSREQGTWWHAMPKDIHEAAGAE